MAPVKNWNILLEFLLAEYVEFCSVKRGDKD